MQIFQIRFKYLDDDYHEYLGLLAKLNGIHVKEIKNASNN